MVTTLQLSWLRERLIQRLAEFPPHSSITVVDRNSVILVRLPNAGRDGTKLTQYPELMTATAEGGTLESEASKTADGVARYLGFTALSGPLDGVVVAVGIPVNAALAGLRQERQRSFLLMAATVLAALAAAWAGGTAFVLRPMAEMLRTAAEWRAGHLDARVKKVGDSSEFRRLGEAFNQMAAALQAALEHKDMLLREMSHRIMNSLQTVSGLFAVQARSIKDGEARSQFSQAVMRINSMALAYRRMHSAAGVESINVADLLHELCGSLHRSMLSEESTCIVETDPLFLGPDQATSLALIVNELMTNAVKHGASGETITVKLGRSTEGCRLAVRNAGALPPGYDPGNTTSGFGMRMVVSLVAQLEGRLEASTMAGETEFAVTFQPKEPQPTVLSVVSSNAAPRT